MAPRAAALILGLLAAATAARANVGTEPVASMVQTYLAKLSSFAKGTMESEFSQEAQDRVQAFVQDGVQALQSLQENMGPFTSELLTQLKEESQKVAERMRQELQQLQGGIASHAAEVGGKVADTMQSVKDFAPVVERVQTQLNEHVAGLKETLKAAVEELKNSGSLPDAEQLQQSIQQQVEQMKGNLDLLAEDFKASLDKGMQTLHTQVSPYMQHTQEQLTRQLGGMSNHMKEKVEQLRAKMLEGTEGLQDSLSLTLKELGQAAQGNAGETLAHITRLNERMEGQVEEFRQKAEQIKEVFVQSVEQGMQELQQNLQRVTGEEDHLRSLEKAMSTAINKLADLLKQTEN